MEEKEQLTLQERKDFENLCKKLSEYLNRINEDDSYLDKENTLNKES